MKIPSALPEVLVSEVVIDEDVPLMALIKPFSLERLVMMATPGKCRVPIRFFAVVTIH